MRDQVKRRLNKGLSNESDLALAEGRLASNSADAAAATAQEKVALSKLSQLTGMQLNYSNLLAQRSSYLEIKDNIDQIQDKAMAISPAVMRVKAQLAQVNAEISESKADRWPELSLEAEYQNGNFDIQESDDEFRVFVAFSTRFGAGLSTMTRIKESRHKKDAAQAEIETQQLLIIEKIKADYARLISFNLRVKALKRSLDTARDVALSYERQFLAGRRTWLDVMNSARDLVNVEIQLADAKAAQLVVSWRLTLLSQGIAVTVGESL